MIRILFVLVVVVCSSPVEVEQVKPKIRVKALYRPQDRTPATNWRPRFESWTPNPRLLV